MLDSPAFRSRELQGSVIGVSVGFHDEPADLHYAVAVTANTKVNGIGRAIWRQVRAVAGIAEVAALPKFVVRRRDSFVSRRGTVPGKAIAKRKASTMRPEFGIVPNGRKEIRTGQKASLELGLIDYCSPGRAVEIRGNRKLKPKPDVLLLFRHD